MKTDKELLERIAEKDAASFEELYRRYHKRAAQWVHSRLKDWDATADLMQDFWTEIWITPALLRTDAEGSCGASMMKNAAFRVLRYFRAQCQCPEVACDELVAEQLSQLAYTHVNEEITADEIRRFLDRLMEELPPLGKRIMELRVLGDMSVKDTARELGIAEKTVYNNLSSTLSTLRHELSVLYNTDDSGKLSVLLPLLISLLEQP